jgi:hypothetical protein
MSVNTKYMRMELYTKNVLKINNIKSLRGVPLEKGDW